MKKKKIMCIVGARPNFMKIAQLHYEMKNSKKIEPVLVHTGQHYDRALSTLFFEQLNIPKPDIDLGIGSASHASQTAQIMMKFEPVLLSEKPDMVLVVGDVNSTIACALVASKLSVKIAHVEAGLRSFDRSMPEEINRILTDSISDYLFTTEKSADDNLLKEGKKPEQIFFVGNVMIDTLLNHKINAESSTILNTLNLSKDSYSVLTLHRPANVDKKENLLELIEGLYETAKKIPVIFPCHPRTTARIEEFGLSGLFGKEIKIIEPLGYLDFLKLMSNSKMVFTDSGGIQEETTVLGIPCLTLRDNTERPVTVTEGTNIIVGRNKEKITEESLKIINGKNKKGNIPLLWDGKAAKRITAILEE